MANREDILFFLSRFYNKLLADASISYLFTAVAKTDMHGTPLTYTGELLGDGNF